MWTAYGHVHRTLTGPPSAFQGGLAFKLAYMQVENVSDHLSYSRIQGLRMPVIMNIFVVIHESERTSGRTLAHGNALCRLKDNLKCLHDLGIAPPPPESVPHYHVAKEAGLYGGRIA